MDLHLKKIPSLKIKNAQGWIYMTPRCQLVVYKKLKKTFGFLADKTLYSTSEHSKKKFCHFKVSLLIF